MLATVAYCADLKYQVRHDHLRKGGDGTITVNADGLSFTEGGKKGEHSRTWKFEEIQWLELSPMNLRVVTYEDLRWQLGRDREYRFHRLPEGMAAQLYPLLAQRLDQRFIAGIADPTITPLWTTPAKMLRGGSGSNGVLKAGADRIVFESSESSGQGSRTWRYSDIEGITSENPLELTISSLDRDTRLQLKQVLPEARYDDLWRRINSKLEIHHD